MEFFSVGGGEEGDGAGSGGGGELRAIGRPREIDGVVVEVGGPVFGELHQEERVVSSESRVAQACGSGGERAGVLC